jgi:prepilin peptidase CpaA
MIALADTSLLAGLGLAAAGLAWAAASDLARYLIPNRACALVVGGYGLAVLALPLSQWLAGAGVGLAAFALAAGLFARGWLGGGDVKLAGAIALWAGPGLLSPFLLGTAVSGALLAGVLVTPVGRRTMRRPAAVATGVDHPMPFGAPLAVGGGWVLALHLSTRF